MQLSVSKSGSKLKLHVIFKEALFNVSQECRQNTVVHKLLNRLPDKNGNEYLHKNKIIVSLHSLHFLLSPLV